MKQLVGRARSARLKPNITFLMRFQVMAASDGAGSPRKLDVPVLRKP
jgi:hypothetical protein